MIVFAMTRFEVHEMLATLVHGNGIIKETSYKSKTRIEKPSVLKYNCLKVQKNSM